MYFAIEGLRMVLNTISTSLHWFALTIFWKPLFYISIAQLLHTWLSMLQLTNTMRLAIQKKWKTYQKGYKLLLFHTKLYIDSTPSLNVIVQLW